MNKNVQMVKILYKHDIIRVNELIPGIGIFYNQVRELNIYEDVDILNELYEAGVKIEYISKHNKDFRGIIMNDLYSGRYHPFVLLMNGEIRTCSNVRNKDNLIKKINSKLCEKEYFLRDCENKHKDNKSCDYVRSFYRSSFKYGRRKQKRRSKRKSF